MSDYLWITMAVHHTETFVGPPRSERDWWEARRVGVQQHELNPATEGLDWVYGWDGPFVDAFKTQLALRGKT